MMETRIVKRKDGYHPQRKIYNGFNWRNIHQIAYETKAQAERYLEMTKPGGKIESLLKAMCSGRISKAKNGD